MTKPTKRTNRRPARAAQPPRADDVTAILLDRLRAEAWPPASTLELCRKAIRDADLDGREKEVEALRAIFEERLKAATGRKGVRASMLDVSRRYDRDSSRFGRQRGEALRTPAEENRRRKGQWAERVAQHVEENGLTLPFPLSASPEEQEAAFEAWTGFGFTDAPEGP